MSVAREKVSSRICNFCRRPTAKRRRVHGWTYYLCEACYVEHRVTLFYATLRFCSV